MSSGNPSSGARRGGRGGPGGGPSPAGSRGGGAGGGMRRKNNANANRNAGNNKTSSGGKQSAQASDLPAGGGVAKQLDEKIASATEALTISSTPGDSTEAEAEMDGDGDIEAAPAGTVDGEVCWICADPVKYASVAECNHRTCHVCALRLRALYKKMECTFCKNPQPKVIFTNSMARPWEEYTLDMIPFSDDKLKISFETSDMMEETLFLLRFNCPDTECTFTGTGWADLKWHTKDMHGLILCDLCIRHKKIFAHEHTLYTPKQIMQHMPSLKRPPALPPQHQNRSKDPDKGGKGKGKEVPESEEGPVDAHPLCSFCKECFYDDDALYAHLRERHEECFVCKRAGERNVYFQNWQKLEEHFQTEHYPCTHASCVEQKFVVFGSALDLQAHQLSTHGQTMGAKERKDKMRIDAGFTFDDMRGRRGRGGATSGRGRGGGGGGREDEPGGTSSRRAAFGGRLTGAGDSQPQQDDHADVVLQLGDLEPLQPHLAPLSTAAQFHVISSVRSYRASECSAREMLDTVFGVFDKNVNVMGPVVNKIVEILDTNEEKKTDVLGQWVSMKAEVRDAAFASVTPVGSSAQWAGIASGRALNIKKSTSQRAARSNHLTSSRVWERVEQVASGRAPQSSSSAKAKTAPKLNSAAFPSLSASASQANASVPGSAQNVRAANAAATQRTPWTSSSSVPSSNPNSGFPSLAPSPTPAASYVQPFSVNVSSSGPSNSSAPRAPNLSQFPTLAASPAARAPAPKGFVSGNKSVNNIRGPAPAPVRSPWGGASPSGGNSGTATPVGDTSSAIVGDEDESGGGKKKKKAKEKLYTLGSF